jgi:AcrR family transcriptional regulator
MKRISNKEAIVTTAIELFNEKGSAAVSTNHIAAALGISPGNLYYHFRNKEEIIRRIYERMVEDMNTAWVADDGLSQSLEKLFSALVALQGMLVNYRFFQKEFSVLLRNDPELAVIYKKVRQDRLQEVEGFFEYLIESGVMRRPEKEQTLPRLIRICWLIGDYWLDFLDIEELPLDEHHIGESVELIREIISPYLIEDA